MSNKKMPWKWQYWMCRRCNIAAKGSFSQVGDFEKHCAGSSPDHRNCSQANEIFDKEGLKIVE